MIPKVMRSTYVGWFATRSGLSSDKTLVATADVLDMKVTFITMPLPGHEHWIHNRLSLSVPADLPSEREVSDAKIRSITGRCIIRNVWWNDTARDSPKVLENICPSVTLCTTNPTRTDPATKPGLRGVRPATDRLSHGKPYLVLNLMKKIFALLLPLTYLLNMPVIYLQSIF